MNMPTTTLFYQNFAQILALIDTDEGRRKQYANLLDNLHQIGTPKVFKPVFGAFTEALHDFYLLTEDEQNLGFQTTDELVNLMTSAYKLLEDIQEEEAYIKPQLKNYANRIRIMGSVLLDRCSRKHDNLISGMEKPAVLVGKRHLDLGKEQFISEDG